MSSSCVRMLDSRPNSTLTRRPQSSVSHRRTSDSPPTTFSKVSPIHGVGRLSRGSTPIRALYIGLVLTAALATIVFLGFLLDDIINDPSTVTRKYKSRSSLDLPKITICNLNPVRYSYLADFEQWVEDQDTGDSEAEALYFGSGKECSLCVDGQIDPALFRDKYAELPSELKAAYGHQLSSMLVSCEFQGQACSSSDFTSYVDETYGNCFSFSSRSVNSSGSLAGLVLELNLETQEYIPYASETEGIRVLLEPQSTPSCSRSNDLTISPGQDNYLALKSSIATGPCANNYVSLSAGVWPTSADKSNSLLTTTSSGDPGLTTAGPSLLSGSTTSPPDLDAIDGSGGSPLSLSGFVAPNMNDYYLHAIGKREAESLKNDDDSLIRDHYTNRNPSFNSQNPARSIFDQDGIATNNDKYFSRSRVDDIDNVTFDKNSNNNNVDVIDNLETQQYTRSISSRDSTSDDNLEQRILTRVRRASDSPLSDSETISQARERFSKLRVYYSSLEEEVESESDVYPWYVATALVGGQLALLCSISAIAIVEAIECFIRFVGRACQNLRTNNKVGISQAWN